MSYEDDLEGHQLINAINFRSISLKDSLSHIQMLIDNIIKDEKETNKLYISYIQKLNKSNNKEDCFKIQLYLDNIYKIQKEIYYAKIDIARIISEYLISDHVKIF